MHSKILIAIALILVSPLFAQEKAKNRPFKRGEKFIFKVYYDSYLTGQVTAGTASLEVQKEVKKIGDTEVYHVVGEGKSKGAFDWLFKVRDRFESFISVETLEPIYFIRRTLEGSYKKDDEVKFDHPKGTATSRTAKKAIDRGTQDLISSFYYARSLDLSDLMIGKTYPVKFFLNDSIYTSVIKYEGKEEIQTAVGKFRCLRFKPMVATGEVFKDEYPMVIWITDDDNRIPVMAQTAVVVGSIKMELIEFSGTAHPLLSKLE